MTNNSSFQNSFQTSIIVPQQWTELVRDPRWRQEANTGALYLPPVATWSVYALKGRKRKPKQSLMVSPLWANQPENEETPRKLEFPGTATPTHLPPQRALEARRSFPVVFSKILISTSRWGTAKVRTTRCVKADGVYEQQTCTAKIR